MQQTFIQFINYELLHVSALHFHLQGAFLVPSKSYSIEEQSIEYCGWVIGTLPEYGNVMPKHVGATIHY
jgi:hypothetical protein